MHACSAVLGSAQASSKTWQVGDLEEGLSGFFFLLMPMSAQRPFSLPSMLVILHACGRRELLKFVSHVPLTSGAGVAWAPMTGDLVLGIPELHADGRLVCAGLHLWTLAHDPYGTHAR
jgi:hypothetical protein